MVDDDDSVFAAMRAGARGYLLKGADQVKILHAVQAMARGEAIFGPTVAQRIIEFFAAPRAARIPAAFPELTSAYSKSSTTSPPATATRHQP